MIPKQGKSPRYVPKSHLTNEERDQLKRISTSLTKTARLLRVSDETVRALLDPLGGVTPMTLERVRQRLEELGQKKAPAPCGAGAENPSPHATVLRYSA